jgi:hypothetical protein
MGFKKNWDVADVARQINTIVYETRSGYNDGFIGWGCKQDLYRIKWLVEDALKRCSTYAPEEEWLREQEKTRVVEILSNDHGNDR